MKKKLNQKHNPFMFMLWLGMMGSVIIFFTIVFIYLHRQSQANWSALNLPPIFWFSSVVMLVSSWAINQAWQGFIDEKFIVYKNWLGVTLILSIIFSVAQVYGWQNMQLNGIQLNNSASGAFIYLLTGLHLAHLLLGMVALAWEFIDAIRHPSYVDSFIQSLNPRKVNRLKMIRTYWHFVDLLWLALFVFFYFTMQHNW